jgi:hypothetical protein
VIDSISKGGRAIAFLTDPSLAWGSVQLAGQSRCCEIIFPIFKGFSWALKARWMSIGLDGVRLHPGFDRL